MKIRNIGAATAVLFLLSGAILFNGCKKKDDSTEMTVQTNPTNNTVMSARDSAVADYNSNYLGSSVGLTGWTGSISGCNAGSVSQSTNDAVLKRINYFRRMVGLNDNCTLDASLFSQEQETALMMKANNALSHYPPATWSCYTSSGSTGASSSDICLGATASAAVTLFMMDDGTGNEPVGHRRWILHSTKTVFSYGSTDISMALYVFGGGSNTHIPSFIAYPAKGYMPQQLMPNRWSFGIPNADFSSANVAMTGPSGNVPLTIISSTANGYGDNTIVWVPTGINTSSSTDVTYTVTVDGMTGAAQSSYTYNVVIIRP